MERFIVYHIFLLKSRICLMIRLEKRYEILKDLVELSINFINSTRLLSLIFFNLLN